MLTTLSQSSLQDYADCPRRFQLRYLERLTYPAVESEPALENEKHQQEGEYFHRLVQQHLLGVPAGQIARLAQGPNLARWWEHFCQTVQPELEGKALFPEVSLSAPLGATRLMAKFDLLAVAPSGSGSGRVTIYDWKTYRRRPKAEWLAARWQTRVYRALLVEAGQHLNGGEPIPAEDIAMVYWFADFPTEPAQFPYNQSLYGRDLRALQALAAEIAAAASFPMTEEQARCSLCPYRSYCDRGRRAGEGEAGDAAGQELQINLEQIQEIEF